ncbi:probable inactive purple acid phosphatase 28 [Magnolia sinica]|uniref:probable inactive purple acid phosphatase 28 n=1 Tax=Magnolia sinica TaxID=86752 RepID=UPI00265B135E|nr:probable inactive purple acid phosphatase 28 [Magnolia sinica]
MYGQWNLLHHLLFIIFLSISLYSLHSLFGNLMVRHDDSGIKIKRSADLPLRFGYDGTFKILQVADMHYGNGIMTRCRDVLASEFQFCSDLNTTRFVRRMIDVEKPDFIAFTRDNIFGSSTSDAAESLIHAFVPAVESKLPWAAVLGNHDQESTMTREELMSFISLMDYSVSQVNPFTSNPFDKKGVVPEIDGFGNYNIRVHGASGSDFANTSILNLYFLDSGDRATLGGIRTYGWIKESQLRWLRSISEGFQGRNLGDEPPSDGIPPALAFYHIPVPEVRQLWSKQVVGQFQEAVACSSVNSGVVRTLVSMGDVKAVFMGHDHNNDFCGEIDGIWFCYGGGCGYHGYGKAGWPRRARVILAELGKGEKAWAGVKRIKTWKRLDDERLSKIDEQILWWKRPLS